MQRTKEVVVSTANLFYETVKVLRKNWEQKQVQQRAAHAGVGESEVSKGDVSTRSANDVSLMAVAEEEDAGGNSDDDAMILDIEQQLGKRDGKL